MVKIDVDGNLEKLKLSFEHLNDDVKRKCKEILTTYGQMARGKAENYTPVLKRAWRQRHKGELKGNWRFLPVKYYKTGNIAVVRVQNETSYGHLVEKDHEVYTAAHKMTKKVNKASSKALQKARVKHHGTRRGDKMLERAFREVESGFQSAIVQMVDENLI